MKALPAAWLRRGLLACLLLPLALLFGALTSVRRLGYAIGLLRTVGLPVPVIVVGNIFVGGTGKTPLVIWLARALSAAGRHPGIVSRGYGAKKGEVLEVGPRSDPALAGDEPVLIASRTGCPVMVGADRVAVGQSLLHKHPEVDLIISDDGLQHYRLARDVEVVVFDARGVGNGWLLPAGPLREPASRRRDFTVINSSQAVLDRMQSTLSDRDDGPRGAAGVTMHMSLEPGNAWQLTDPGQRLPLAPLCAGRRVLAAAGIGNPARFFTMLEAIGLQFERLPLPDHFAFEHNPFEALDAEIILITEKDAVKCRLDTALNRDTRLWVVPVTAALDGPLAERILEKLRGSPPA